MVENWDLVKHRDFGEKSRFWSKTEILVKNWDFGQKLRFWSKIEILVENLDFGGKSRFWLNVEITAKNRHLLKFQFGLEIKILAPKQVSFLFKNVYFALIVQSWKNRKNNQKSRCSKSCVQILKNIFLVSSSMPECPLLPLPNWSTSELLEAANAHELSDD